MPFYIVTIMCVRLHTLCHRLLVVVLFLSYVALCKFTCSDYFVNRIGISLDGAGVYSPLVTFDRKQHLRDWMPSAEPDRDEDLITIGARKLGLVASAGFHSDVACLLNLTNVHQTVCDDVIGL